MSDALAQEQAKARAVDVARNAYGRLLALLVSRTRDVAAAEDALSEALTRALTTWPTQGVPNNPEAWIFTVAKNRLFDDARRAKRWGASPLTELEEMTAPTPETNVPDRRLRLMFVCAHPAIDESVRTPLMLQVILGLDADTVGGAFLVPPRAMAQRLVRAKRKIKAAGIKMRDPDPEELPARMGAVLEAIYGAFATEEDDGLRSEAEFLARMVVALAPGDPEALGLLARILYAKARVVPAAVFVPLSERDPETWNRDEIAEADALLAKARRARQLGRFQLEAAIESVHCARIHTGVTDWTALVFLYEGLMHLAPTIGAAVARAAAVGEARGAEAGLRALSLIDESALETFQPAWATRAHLLARAGDPVAARAAFTRAIELTERESVRAYLSQQRARLDR